MTAPVAPGEILGALEEVLRQFEDRVQTSDVVEELVTAALLIVCQTIDDGETSKDRLLRTSAAIVTRAVTRVLVALTEAGKEPS